MSTTNNPLPDPNPFFTHLLEAATPEKRQELLKVLGDLGITFVVDPHSEDIAFCADPGTRQITIGIKGLGRLWCHAYSAFVFMHELSAEKLKNPAIRQVDLRTTDRRRKAGDLLRWAMEHEIALDVLGSGFRADAHQIQKGLPVPFAPGSKGSDEDMADELCLVALSFILHHEIAHLRLNHLYVEGPRSFQQEKEADAAGADWLLSDTGLSVAQRTKRQLGCALGLAWLTSLDVYLGVTPSNTHPPTPERLFEMIEFFEKDPNGYVWAFVMVLLGLHLRNKAAPLDDSKVFGSHKDAVAYYIAMIPRKVL